MAKGVFKRTMQLGFAFAMAAIVVSCGFAIKQSRDVQEFCAAVKPGTPVDSLKDLAQLHGLGPRDLKIYDQRARVAVLMTMGDTSCMITHDNFSVAEARMSQAR